MGAYECAQHCVRFGSIFGPHPPPKKVVGVLLFDLEGVRSDTGVQEASRPPQDPPKSTPRGPKNALRAAQDQPKTLKIAKIAEIDETQKPKPQFADDKKAGGRR